MNNTTLTAEKVLDQVEKLCQVLRTNYQSYCIQSHRRWIEGGHDETGYHQKQIDNLCEGEDLDDFIYEKGRRYAKVIHVTKGGSQSAHAFVDLTNGDCYKAASWKAPAKHVRYNLLDDQSRTEMFRRADWAGSYLYLR